MADKQPDSHELIEPIALHLRDHQVELVNWTVGRTGISVVDLVRELHRFVQVFNVEF